MPDGRNGRSGRSGRNGGPESGRAGGPESVREALEGPYAQFLLSAWPLRCWAYVFSGAVFGYAVLVLLFILTLAGVALSVFGIGIAVLAGTSVLGVPVAAVERRRLRLVDPVPLADPHRRLSGVGVRGWFRARLKERATWRELGHTAVLGVLFTLTGSGLALLLALSLGFTAAPLVVWAVAPDTVMLLPGVAAASPAAALPATPAGLVGVLLCALAGGRLAGIQTRIARSLLSPRDEDLSNRVIELTRSRARLIDAFEAERRRIERDLHDGAQQQLVALSMTLGLAEMRLEDDDSRAKELIVRARGEARLALEQLRRLVRDIHPQVLTDHGLAAAVAEVALRNPIPVTVDIDLPRRLPGPVESMAYFTVTEALTNASKHSGASRIAVVGRFAGERLDLTITDDGRGGAAPAAGGGLQGLADRMAILRGRLTVSSPPGGPTELRVEVPCSG
ncbi:sensor histidine kinase [Streptomyces solicathayae]|uniref:histidine kinase n=1 Tax=Streptomyces solicathayae TaxID=3081768 RepID=A0ABZ0LPZ2_9ACTN|nr:sensor domain-containing protein [Streptomyces sp. HUAS YS2]WOX21559.1 sensor domain-containing protein [Streptomyces sp. HUAS YS2]